jgi:UDP-GlcNAc:undecaprenyl-phosphate GlcNAc-1-phosphate transferase
MAQFLLHLSLAVPLGLVSALAVRAMIARPILDVPNHRSSHARPTPKGGGVGPVVAFVLGMLLLWQVEALSDAAEPRFLGVVLAAIAIALVALADDIRDFRFLVKLAAQTFAALVAIGSGLVLQRIALPWVGEVPLGALGVALTLFWIVGCTNAVNFMDGLDGLVGGVVVIASLALAVVAATQGGPTGGGGFVQAAALFLAAGFAGFLVFNLPPARVFMGDVGSQFAGFVLAVLAVAAGGFDDRQVSFLVVPLLLFGLLWDAAFTLVRRALAGARVSEAHRTHLYQMAARSGMRARDVALVHWGFALFHAALAALFLLLDSRDKPLVVVPAVLAQVAWTLFVARRVRRANLSWAG